MKYIVILGDGMADEPLEELGGKTPLEYARTPAMDRIAREGASGLLKTVPEGFEAGSDIANLSILGYDPATCYTGRGPLEALSMGIDLGEQDVAYRANLVTIRDGVMEDFNAGHISSAEGAALLHDLSPRLSRAKVFAGISYRNLLVIPGGEGAVTVPPHDIVGQKIAPHLPSGGDAALLGEVMAKSRTVFSGHPVNQARIAAGKLPSTQVWPWSGGKKPALTPFREKYGRSGGMISAVDLLNGIARAAKMEVISVPGATGYLDTDYLAKARYALAALKRLDFMYVHVEAPDEAGHMGGVQEKIEAIEHVDEMIGTILDEFYGVIAVLHDHPTPIRARTHTRDPVPFAIRGREKDNTLRFSEKEAAKGSYGIRDAGEFLSLVFGAK
jgi:2,3-bisphosphoglycerate-independent phosphoglycerate mutase